MAAGIPRLPGSSVRPASIALFLGSSRRRVRLLPGLSVLGLLAATGFPAGCGSEVEPPNRPPTVTLTSSPVDGDQVHYRVHLAWIGEDPDGSIRRYEYVVDPPPEFSETEIAEGGEDITSVFVPGEDGAPDVTRVSKVADGEAVSFEWIHTALTSRRFEFSTPEADSAVVDTVLAPTGRFHGYHAVYVRAVDDDGAVSPPDKTAFNAITVAPRSWITRPLPALEFLTLGPGLSAQWSGRDPDAGRPNEPPAAFQYKLLRIDTLEPPIPLHKADAELLWSEGGAWIHRSADSADIALPLEVPGYYLFGVRGVDAAGATEPFLDFGRNVLRFGAFAIGGLPLLTIQEPGTGAFTYRGMAAGQSVQTALGIPLRFLWSASAESYGGVIDAYSWGVDLVDLDDEGPDSGWSPWGPFTHPLEPVVFTTPGLHNLCVRVRDDVGSITRGVLYLDVIDFPFDREVLLVDDSFDDTFPRDSENDAFWMSLITDYLGLPPEQIYRWEAHGANDRENLDPKAPLLSDLARYKLLIWECRGSGYNAQTALNIVTAKTTRLAAYLRAGGNLWLGGRMTVAATTLESNKVGGDLTYPKEDLGPGNFAYDFLKLHSTRIVNDKGERDQNLLNRANPFPEPPVRDRWGGVIKDLPYDTLRVHLPKLNLAHRSKGGVSFSDTVWDPLLAEAEPGFRGDLDSLYVYGAAGPWYQGRSSAYEGRLCGLRWHDPDPAREHGRIQWFGFSLYFMETEQAKAVFRKSLDWFRQEEPPHPTAPGRIRY